MIALPGKLDVRYQFAPNEAVRLRKPGNHDKFIRGKQDSELRIPRTRSNETHAALADF